MVLITGEANCRVAGGGLLEGRQSGNHSLEGQTVVGIEMNLELGVSQELW